MGDIYRKSIINISRKIEENKLYQKFIKRPWPYVVGVIILALLNIGLLYLTNVPLRVSSIFLYLPSSILETLGIDISSLSYFDIRGLKFDSGKSFINNYYTFLALGIILGSLVSALWASEFKIKKIKNTRQVAVALIGGIMMGYSSRIVVGCNLGAYFSAIPSYSLHGWVFAVAVFIGAYIGSKIIMKFIL